MNNKNKLKLTDQDIILDALYSQKQISNEYNQLILDCTTPTTRNSIIAILCEEYRIHGELLDEMQKRNWNFTIPINDEIANCVKDNLLKKQ